MDTFLYSTKDICPPLHALITVSAFGFNESIWKFQFAYLAHVTTHAIYGDQYILHMVFSVFPPLRNESLSHLGKTAFKQNCWPIDLESTIRPISRKGHELTWETASEAQQKCGSSRCFGAEEFSCLPFPGLMLGVHLVQFHLKSFLCTTLGPAYLLIHGKMQTRRQEISTCLAIHFLFPN